MLMPASAINKNFIWNAKFVKYFTGCAMNRAAPVTTESANAHQVHGSACRQISVTAVFVDAIPIRRRSTTVIMPTTTAIAAICSIKAAWKNQPDSAMNCANLVVSSHFRISIVTCKCCPRCTAPTRATVSAEEIHHPPSASGERHRDPQDQCERGEHAHDKARALLGAPRYAIAHDRDLKSD